MNILHIEARERSRNGSLLGGRVASFHPYEDLVRTVLNDGIACSPEWGSADSAERQSAAEA